MNSDHTTSSRRPSVCLVVGTRPEAVKIAPVYQALQQSERLTPWLLSTGQHRQLLDQALSAFDLVPDHDLQLMQPSQQLPDLTSRALSCLADCFRKQRPDAVLVQGDTTTVLSAALAAFYENIPIGHVEAGLRTGNMRSPWPEEMNRRLIAPLCRWHFTPTEWGRDNLLKEQIPADRCFVTGNTVIDALLWTRARLRRGSVTCAQITARLQVPNRFASRYLAGGDPWILVTGHRRESFGAGFERICDALLTIVERFPQAGLLYPVHLNPQVRGLVRERLGNHERIALTEPAGYEDFIWLMDRCRFLISDSGGVQEEAPCLGKPVLVTRDTTERPEGVTAGTCRLVGTDSEAIVREATLLLTDREEYQRRSQLANPYGDGRAAQRIRQVLEDSL